MLLRPGKTPSGREVRGHLRRLVRLIRRHRAATRLTIRGETAADDVRTRRAEQQVPVLRGYTEIRYAARSWKRERRVVARIEATTLGLHKGQLASDRTSCRSPLSNQMRLILHTAAYWLLLRVRDVIPEPQALARAEFATTRLRLLIRWRLLKIAARVTDTASRVRIAFAAACPQAALFRSLATALAP